MKQPLLRHLIIGGCLAGLCWATVTWLFPERAGLNAPEKVQPQIIALDSALHKASERTDTLQSAIHKQNAAVNSVKSQLGHQSERADKRLAEVTALPPDEQIEHFNLLTGGADTLAVCNTATDTLVWVPLSQLREANRKLTRLESLTATNLLLTELLQEQECALTLHQTLQSANETRISLLEQQNQHLKTALAKQERALQRAKRKEGLMRIGVGVGVTLVVIALL